MAKRVRNKVLEAANLRAWRASNPEKAAKQYVRNYAARADRYRADPAAYLWRTAKQRAKKFNQPFDIDAHDVVVPDTCPILGIKIDVLTSNYHNRASLDRVVNALGYVKGNVRVISRKANRLKGDATVHEVECLLKYMKGEV